MRFEFDPVKDDKNRKNHGISLTEAQSLWERNHVIIPAKNVAGENRSAILGQHRGNVYAAIFTQRQDVTRIISCHRADKKLERIYHAYLKREKIETH